MAKFLDQATTVPLGAYIQSADPAVAMADRLQAKTLWIDTTATPPTLKRRNDTNDGWDTIGKIYSDSDLAGGLADDSVTNAKLAEMAQATIKGRAAGAGTGNPVDLTAAQVKTILALASGDISGLDAAVDARIKLLQKWALNFTDDGDAYIPAYEAMTVDIGTAAIGTGTLAYEKSTTASPDVFTGTSLPATLQAGAWLKVTVSGLTGFKAVELKRTA